MPGHAGSPDSEEPSLAERWTDVRVRRKWLTAGGLALALAVAMPTVAAATSRTTGLAGRDGGMTGAAQSAVARRPLAAVLARLSAQQLAGQRVIYSYPGLTPPAA